MSKEAAKTALESAMRKVQAIRPEVSLKVEEVLDQIDIDLADAFNELNNVVDKADG